MSIRSALPEFVAFAAERRDDYHRVKFRRERAFAFTLAEIMIVVAVIALLVVLALAGFMRARKRAKGARVKEEIRVRKEADQRTETVRDTVRHTEVEVEDDRAEASTPGAPSATPRRR